MKRLLMLMAVGVMVAGEALAQEPIRIGAMYPLTGGGAIYGVPALAGHQLAIEEINRRGGIMGRKVESIERDDKMNPSAASATMKELITKNKVHIVLGGLSSAVGLGMSEVSKQEKVVYIATIPKSIQITTTKLHPYVFRIASNTDLEGDTMAMLVAKYNLKKLCHLQLDYAYGHDLEAGVLKALPKRAPNAKVVWNTEVLEILGGDKVTGVRLVTHPRGNPRAAYAKDPKDPALKVWEMPTQGVFIAIGHSPDTDVFKGHVGLDVKGYVAVQGHVRTNVEGVFAAGDVHDAHYRQAVTAAGFGCMAALEAERWLAGQG